MRHDTHVIIRISHTTHLAQSQSLVAVKRREWWVMSHVWKASWHTRKYMNESRDTSPKAAASMRPSGVSGESFCPWYRPCSCCSVLQCVAVCCSVLRIPRSLLPLVSPLFVLQCVAACCSALQCVAVRCRALPCVAVCCSVLQYVAVCQGFPAHFCPWYLPCSCSMCCSVLHCVAVCCSAIPCVAVRYSVLQCVAVCCSVLQCVAVCCSVWVCQKGIEGEIHTQLCTHTNAHTHMFTLTFHSVCRSVLQSVAVCCSMLQCVAA